MAHCNRQSDTIIRLASLRIYCEGCYRCHLSQQRIKMVFGEGPPDPTIVWLGEGPGRNENITGIPFCGLSGKLLRKYITDARLMKISYIMNVIKCWPGPGNPSPTAECTKACRPMITSQLELLRPRLIVAVGKTALAWCLDLDPNEIKIGRYINQPFKHKIAPVFPIYHPSYIIRKSEKERNDYWNSFKNIRRAIKGI